MDLNTKWEIDYPNRKAQKNISINRDITYTRTRHKAKIE